MKPTTIGILQADGSFFPIAEESQVGVKKLTLTAARPGQESVRIDIRSSDAETESGLHLGTLALQRSGTGDIELVIDLDDQGRLTATAAWPQGTAKQSISVDLKDYHQDSEIPELESFESLPEILEPPAEEPLQEGEAPLRSDREILNDDSLDTFELDDFDSEPAEALTNPSDDLTLGESLTLDLPDVDSLKSWDEPASTADPLDWGDEAEFPESAISPEVTPPVQKVSQTTDDDPYEFPDLSLDDTPALELSDLDHEESSSSLDLSAEPEEPIFDEMPAWEPEVDFLESSEIPADTIEDKPELATAFAPNPRTTAKPAEPSSPPQVDRISLVLSLTTLGLLVAVLLGLLFMNFMRPASPPALRPESFLMPSGPSLAMASAPDPLAIPDALRSTEQQYQLRLGDHSRDLERRFGPVVAKKTLTAWTW